MKTYHFDIESGAVETREVLIAADDAAAVRQAVLLLSEILRDHALVAKGDIEVRIRVRDRVGRPIWAGASSVHALAPPPP
ncbi:hypothetical protein [Caulobacter sp. CCH9-E1]|jgi:hypothetical protein|uniref:DUF6894 family protein n=1 Tax=Caulobacter sp. CCH9-E1 TaxID=1768768 RepID=UPI0008327741|nr:hypothetical protein [Caulobacter sp. CCH9-E1]